MSATLSPLVLDTDMLWLAEDFIIRGQKPRLIDTSLGVFHSCDPKALPLIQALQRGLTLPRLLAAAHTQGITTEELQQFLDFLNVCGALYRTRSLKHYPLAWRTHFLHCFFGTVYKPITWRRRLSIGAILVACLRACRALFGAILIVDVLCILAWRWSFLSVLSMSAAGVTIFVCSIVVHEYAHARVIAYWGHPLMVVQRGSHVGLLHARLSRSIEVLSALCGPLAGCTAAASAALVLHAQQLYGLAAVCMGIAALHLGSLFPWYDDGRIIWINFHNNKGNI